MKAIILLVTLVSLLGCGSIKHTNKIEQKLNVPLLAGVGDMVLRVKKRRNLENAVGGADIFGRKTTEGFVELRYRGVEPDGSIVLSRRDINIYTNETTMSRTPIASSRSSSNSSIQGNVKPNQNQIDVEGKINTTSTSTVIVPQEDYHVMVPAGEHTIRLDSSEMQLPISGFLVHILSVTRNSIQYKISNQ